MARVKRMQTLRDALDAESLEWLNDNKPQLVDALEVEIANGATPQEIKRLVIRHTQRIELALRLEQATRAILAGDDR